MKKILFYALFALTGCSTFPVSMQELRISIDFPNNSGVLEEFYVHGPGRIIVENRSSTSADGWNISKIGEWRTNQIIAISFDEKTP